MTPQRRSLVFVALVGLLTLSWPSSAPAAPPAHSPDACVCHFDGNGGPDERNGSNATNATICVQSFNSGKHWCDVTIECLRNFKMPGCDSRSKVISSLPSLFEDHLRALRATPGGSANANQLEGGLPQLNKLVQDPPRDLQNCVVNFEKGVPMKPTVFDKLSCGVSDSRKWLFIDYVLQELSVRFLFSPQ
jgi:hypothetical protein